MDDKEKIQSFADMVEATDKLAAPWRKANLLQTIALIATNLLWAIIVAMLVYYAYMTPVDLHQEQDFDSSAQSQDYSSGVTQGE